MFVKSIKQNISFCSNELELEVTKGNKRCTRGGTTSPNAVPPDASLVADVLLSDAGDFTVKSLIRTNVVLRETTRVTGSIAEKSFSFYPRFNFSGHKFVSLENKNF